MRDRIDIDAQLSRATVREIGERLQNRSVRARNCRTASDVRLINSVNWTKERHQPFPICHTMRSANPRQRRGCSFPYNGPVAGGHAADERAPSKGRDRDRYK
jgi:hypothetical protein